MAVNREKWARKVITLERAIAEQVKEFRFRNRFETENGAIRELVRIGLEASATSPGTAQADA